MFKVYYKGITDSEETDIGPVFSSLEGAREEINLRISQFDTSLSDYRITSPGHNDKSLDMVDAPPHYTRLNPQPLEVITAWGLNFPIGSAIKYLARAGHKEGADALTDYKKAVSFIQYEIKKLEAK